jgi:hypothetical protein
MADKAAKPEPKPHFTQAPESLRREFGSVLDAARKHAKPDALGRVDWSAINRDMTAWWGAKGYIFP